MRLETLMLTFVLAMACTGRGTDPEPAPAPPIPTETDTDLPPIPEPPAAPDGTDFSTSGAFGKIGVDPYDTDEVRDVDAGGEPQGGTLGSSLNDQRYWDAMHPFDKCPDDPIYVYGVSFERANPQCQPDGMAANCAEAERLARRRAENVWRSCERAPSCRAGWGQVGQDWECFKVRAYDGEDESGQPRFRPDGWGKSCSVQYKVTCVSL